jgi:hypothetical protein
MKELETAEAFGPQATQTKIARPMTDSTKTIKRMVLESLSGEMASGMKVSLRKVESMGKELSMI